MRIDAIEEKGGKLYVSATLTRQGATRGKKATAKAQVNAELDVPAGNPDRFLWDDGDLDFGGDGDPQDEAGVAALAETAKRREIVARLNAGVQ